MSEKLDDGGPAFPMPEQQFTGGMDGHYGMSLRDYFIAHAPVDLDDARHAFHSVEGNYVQPSGAHLMEILVDLRIAYADTVIKTRQS